MNIHTLTWLLKIGGLLHIGLICAGAMMPAVVGLRSNIASLPPFIRRLFWVYYAFIGLCLISFGLLTFLLAGTLAQGGMLARAICIFLGAFWGLRLFAASLIFDVRPYLINRYRWLGYHATNIAFAYLPFVYFLTAWKGGGNL